MRAVILLCLVGAALAVPRSNRIVGGQDTTIQEYPYMANMQFGWFGIIWFQACGGSLLTSNVVLSAAHCYYGDTEEHWRVILGSSVSSGADGTEFIVKELFIHEKYNSWTLDNDVALVRLSQSATLGSTIGVARIAGATFHLPDNTPVKAIGWGALSSDGPPAEQLQHVEIYTINHQICAERYEKLQSQPGFENWPEITNGMLCAGVLDVGGRDACQGDSGGPLAYDRDIIVGVTSWGYDCAHDFYPGVNARVSFYSEWIVNNINSRI